MTPLGAKIRRLIEAEGPISVEAYMEICLGDAEHGYYRAAHPLGRAGDFITAPEISQIFGELIGLWSAAMWAAMGAPARVNLIELGPGRGTLMADALRAGRAAPGFLAAADLHLVETSRILRESQAGALGAYRPAWHESVETVEPGPSIVIANEFFDALPVRQQVYSEGRWRERKVGLGDDGALRFAPGEDAPDQSGEAREGEIREMRPAAGRIVAALSARAPAHALAALIIDYGYHGEGGGDTLQAVARHHYTPPLQAPGEADLSAHVDFRAVADEGRDGGLTVHGPLPMGLFLSRLGAGRRLEKLCGGANEMQRQALRSGLRRLVSPAEMGELFKAMALTRGIAQTPPPFQDVS